MKILTFRFPGDLSPKSGTGTGTCTEMLLMPLFDFISKYSEVQFLPPRAARLVRSFPKLTDVYKTSEQSGSGIVTTCANKWQNLADWPDGCETSSTESSPVGIKLGELL